MWRKTREWPSWGEDSSTFGSPLLVESHEILALTRKKGPAKFKPESRDITPCGVKKFLQAYTNGSIFQHFIGEPIPNSWNKKPVKQLVGKTFARVMVDRNFHVIVNFCAGDCCKSTFLSLDSTIATSLCHKGGGQEWFSVSALVLKICSFFMTTLNERVVSVKHIWNGRSLAASTWLYCQ